MASNKSRPADKRPTPSQVMERYRRTSGEPIVRRDEVVGYAEGYAVGGDYMDQAKVIQTYVGGTATTSIGHYNPATGRWLFVPEYIQPDEQPAMERMIRSRASQPVQQMNARLMDDGAPIVDVYHPYTRKTRAELDAMLRPLQLSRFLGRPAARAALTKNGSHVRAIDSYTYVYPLMGTTVGTRTQVEEVGVGDTITTPYLHIGELSRFILSVRGAKVENESQLPGHTLRETRKFVIARRGEEYGSQWTPDPNVVQPEEWPLLLGVANALEAAHTTNPDFSLLHAAVTYGNEYAHTRAETI